MPRSWVLLLALAATSLGVAGLAVPANAAPAPAASKPACATLDDIQRNTSEIDDSLATFRGITTFTFTDKQPGMDNVAVQDRSDARAISADASQIGDSALVSQASELGSSVDDMKDSFDALFGRHGSFESYPTQANWNFVDHVGDVELGISAAVDKLRAAGCA